MVPNLPTFRRLGSALRGDARDLVARPQRRLSIAWSHGAGTREPLRELMGSWHGFLQLWPWLSVISTKKTTFVGHV
jgi:hypothetical protein